MGLLDRLRSVVSDERDIEHVIRAAAGGSDTRDTPDYVIFRTSDSEPKTFARARIKRGRITALELGDPLRSREAQDDLVERGRRESAQNHGSKVVRRTLFSSLRIDGAFTWNDTVQLRPCSPGVVIDEPQTWMIEPDWQAPDIQRDGPPFPVVLEVRVPGSPNPWIQVNRRLRLLQWWQNVLTVFLPGDLRAPATTPERIWTFRVEDGVARNRLVDAGFQPGEDGPHDDFSVAKPGELSPTEGFYDRLWSNDQVLMFPESLPDDLASLQALNSDERSAFARAAYWFSVGLRSRIRREDPVAFTSFAAAIESLLPRIKKHQCPTCNQETGNRTTYFFNKYLDIFVPVIDDLKNKQKNLYNFRSKLAHGLYVQDADIDTFSCGNENTDLLMLEWNARKSLVNWVRSPDRSTWHIQ